MLAEQIKFNTNKTNKHKNHTHNNNHQQHKNKTQTKNKKRQQAKGLIKSSPLCLVWWLSSVFSLPCLVCWGDYGSFMFNLIDCFKCSTNCIDYTTATANTDFFQWCYEQYRKRSLLVKPAFAKDRDLGDEFSSFSVTTFPDDFRLQLVVKLRLSRVHHFRCTFFEQKWVCSTSNLFG